MTDLIKRDDALRIVEEYDVLHDHIKALPAVDPAAIRDAALTAKLAECEAQLGDVVEALQWIVDHRGECFIPELWDEMASDVLAELEGK